MRIFHLVPNLNYGGLQKVVELLALHQVRSGHSVTIGCWTFRCNHPEAEAELQAKGVKVVYLRRGEDGAMSHGKRASLNKLKSYLGTGKADILHVHNPFGYLIYGALAARLAGSTKSLVSVHATLMFDHPGFGRRGRTEFWIACLLMDGVVSVCDEVKDFLRKRFWLPSRKMLVVDNGIELSRFLAVADRCPGEEIVFGAAGRMTWEKGHRVLIEAFALVHRHHAAARLRLLGGGGLKDTLMQRARDLGLADVVEFCGFGNDVPGFLSTLDCYVLPSLSEAQPLGLMEAIASGRPVVATSVGGVPKIVQSTNAGWLCEANDPAALATAMEKAIANRHRAELTTRARELAATFYSAQRMAAEYQEVYETLIVGAQGSTQR